MRKSLNHHSEEERSTRVGFMVPFNVRLFRMESVEERGIWDLQSLESRPEKGGRKSS